MFILSCTCKASRENWNQNLPNYYWTLLYLLFFITLSFVHLLVILLSCICIMQFVLYSIVAKIKIRVHTVRLTCGPMALTARLMMTRGPIFTKLLTWHAMELNYCYQLLWSFKTHYRTWPRYLKTNLFWASFPMILQKMWP